MESDDISSLRAWASNINLKADEYQKDSRIKRPTCWKTNVETVDKMADLLYPRFAKEKILKEQSVGI